MRYNRRYALRHFHSHSLQNLQNEPFRRWQKSPLPVWRGFQELQTRGTLDKMINGEKRVATSSWGIWPSRIESAEDAFRMRRAMESRAGASLIATTIFMVFHYCKVVLSSGM